MFAPSFGVVEDPGTGSAAGPLACHLARHGLIEWGQEIEIEQGTEIHRPCRIVAHADGGAGLKVRDGNGPPGEPERCQAGRDGA